MSETSSICNPYRPLGKGVAASETSFAVNVTAFLLSLGMTALSYAKGFGEPVELATVMMVSMLVFTVALETAFFRKTCAVWRLRKLRALSWRRVAYREVALVATFAALALVYWAFPMFADRDMQRHYYPFLGFLVPILVVLSVPYFCLMDRRDPEEEDAFCRVGRAIVTRRHTMTRFELGNYVRSWAVKAFWLSLMQPAMVEKFRVFMLYHWEKLAGNPMEIYLVASTACFAIDLCFAATGYLMNLKMFNTHTRTAEPTLLGWLVAICSYWPFWGILFYPYFFKYEAPHQWETLFAAGSAIWWAWAGAIIALELLYAAATASGGLHFSNLTYRGLWNTGPYRWTKHPAYVFKNISWWLISLPFVVNTGAAAVKCTLLLLGVNVIYFLRARTEERHLSHYPEYVAYALEMNERSVFRWCARLLPFLKYRPPESSARLFEVRQHDGGDGV